MRRGLLPLLFLAAACAPAGPRAIAYGTEPCGHCHMTVLDPRFSAEALTPGGQAVVFDDVGCLAAWLAAAPTGAVGWVMSFTDAGTWLPADSQVYLRSAALGTPMASGLAALRPGREADSVSAALGGTLLTWDQVRASTSPDGHAHPVAR